MKASSLAHVEWLAGALTAVDERTICVGGPADDPEIFLGAERGEPADRVDLLGEIEGIIVAFGRALAAMHAAPRDDAPLPVGWEAIRSTIESNLGTIDPAQLPKAYARYTPDQLFDIWQANRPATEDLVVCHGAPLLENVLLHSGTTSGYRDLHRMRIADRHLDLAVAHHSVHARFGGDASFIFYDAYGTDPDLLRLDHYTLAGVLLP
jgi:kanamycin kinase/aminoglycoside 3'-phosphotransferase-2